MTEERVFQPEVIQENPFPGEQAGMVVSTPTNGSGDNLTTTTTKSKAFPTKKVATELIGQALNTRSKKILAEFDLVQSGGLKIGSYEEGVSGDLRITPNGIVARDQSGLTTFAIDALTGDAIFRGTVQAGSVIVGGQILDENGDTIIDENGLVSTNNFETQTVTSSSAFDTSNTSFVDVDNMTLTTTDLTRPATVLILFTTRCTIDSIGGIDSFDASFDCVVNIDGTDDLTVILSKRGARDSGTGEQIQNLFSTHTIHSIRTLEPGVHTIKIRCKINNSSGTATANIGRRVLSYVFLGK